jgi:hypothetical protein
MGFAGNTSEQKVIASRNSCAKDYSYLNYNEISALLHDSCRAAGAIFQGRYRAWSSAISSQKILRSVA